MSEGHPYVLKQLPVEIDVDIAPVVDWLNSHVGVRTLYSCQGDPFDLHHDEWAWSELPHASAMFACEDPGSLLAIMEIIEDWNFDESGVFNHHPVRVEVDYHAKQKLRYQVYWPENGQLRAFTQWLSGRLAVLGWDSQGNVS